MKHVMKLYGVLGPGLGALGTCYGTSGSGVASGRLLWVIILAARVAGLPPACCQPQHPSLSSSHPQVWGQQGGSALRPSGIQTHYGYTYTGLVPRGAPVKKISPTPKENGLGPGESVHTGYHVHQEEGTSESVPD